MPSNAGTAYRDNDLALADGPHGDLIARAQASRTHDIDWQGDLVLGRHPRHILYFSIQIGKGCGVGPLSPVPRIGVGLGA
jgi:hypothetical protein